jgi:ABC-type transport system substrate-binding protein
MYPYDPDKAKQLLAQAGYPHGIKLNVLYRTTSDSAGRTLATLQQDLARVGIAVEAVPSSNADLYAGYLQVPEIAERGVWDLALASWSADWTSDAAVSYFNPLFSGPSSFPPMGSNYGFYNTEATNALIQQATSAISPPDIAAAWSRADRQVMSDAAIYPITNPTWVRGRLRLGAPRRLRRTGRTRRRRIPTARHASSPGVDATDLRDEPRDSGIPAQPVQGRRSPRAGQRRHPDRRARATCAGEIFEGQPVTTRSASSRAAR